ncbi:hypothetical protein AB5N19_03020 [Seiridium cardinale]
MHISRVRIGATLASLLVSEATRVCTPMDNITLSRNVDVVIIGGRASDMLPSGRVTKTRVWPWSSKGAYLVATLPYTMTLIWESRSTSACRAESGMETLWTS